MLSLFQCYKIFKYFFIFSIFLYLQACSLDPSLFDEELKDVTEIRQTQKFLNKFDTIVVKSGDTLLFGRESAGVPENIHKQVKDRLKIPMKNKMRSLNISSSVAIILSESLKQTKLLIKK